MHTWSDIHASWGWVEAIRISTAAKVAWGCEFEKATKTTYSKETLFRISTSPSPRLEAFDMRLDAYWHSSATTIVIWGQYAFAGRDPGDGCFVDRSLAFVINIQFENKSDSGAN